MIDSLDPSLPVEKLYDYREKTDGGVPLWTPYHQGDVFRLRDVPGLDPVDEESGYAMLFMHPCTMREANGAIREKVTVVRVHKYSKRVVEEPQHWERKFKVFPLPDLLGEGKTHVADFMQIATVRSADIPRSTRVAQLSHRGRISMQQRIVFHLTRYPQRTDDLAEAVAHVEAEAQAQSDWVQTAAYSVHRPAEVTIQWAEAREAEMQEFIGTTDDPDSLRNQLADTRRRSDATRDIQKEIARRYPLPPD